MDGVTGLLLPSGDSEIWVKLLTELADDPAKLVAHGADFATNVRELYSEKEMGRQLTEILQLPS